MCTTNEKFIATSGFNTDAGAKFQPGDLVIIGNDKRKVFPVVKCHADYAELDAGEGSVYNISLSYLSKLNESSAVGAILNGKVVRSNPPGFKSVFTGSGNSETIVATGSPIRPSHYGESDNPYEARKVIKAWGADFSLGNVLKYISRHKKKGNPLEDLKKAQQYLTFAIEEMEGRV